MVKKVTIPELANWKIPTGHCDGQTVKKSRARMVVAFAVLVEDLDTIPEHVQRFTLRKFGLGPNEGVFVHTVKRQVTMFKPVPH